MSIFQKISSVFADKAIAPKLENAAIAFVDNTFVDKNLEEGIIADLLETYGNEPFYTLLHRSNLPQKAESNIL